MHRFVIPLLLLLAFAAGCSNDDKSSNTGNMTSDSAAQPTSEVSGAKIYLYDRGQVTTEVIADKILKFDTRDSTMAYVVDINSFDSLGNVATHVVGDSAIIRENDGRFTIYGNVVVTTEDGMRLETDYLHWNSKNDRIFTDAFVRITTPDEVVRGWGMEADRRLKRYKILHQVSGEMDDAKKLESGQ